MGKGRWHSNAGMNGFPEKFGRQESSRLEDMESTILCKLGNADGRLYGKTR